MRYKRFNQQPSFGEVCGPVRKPKIGAKTFAQKKFAQSKSIKQKTVVESKAKQLISKLKPYNAKVLAELIRVVKANPNLALEDIYSNVFRNLKAKNPNEQYSGSVVSSVYLIAKKEGVIEVK